MPLCHHAVEPLGPGGHGVYEWAVCVVCVCWKQVHGNSGRELGMGMTWFPPHTHTPLGSTHTPTTVCWPCDWPSLLLRSTSPRWSHGSAAPCSCVYLRTLRASVTLCSGFWSSLVCTIIFNDSSSRAHRLPSVLPKQLGSMSANCWCLGNDNLNDSFVVNVLAGAGRQGAW